MDALKDKTNCISQESSQKDRPQESPLYGRNNADHTGNSHNHKRTLPTNGQNEKKGKKKKIEDVAFVELKENETTAEYIKRLKAVAKIKESIKCVAFIYTEIDIPFWEKHLAVLRMASNLTDTPIEQVALPYTPGYRKKNSLPNTNWEFRTVSPFRLNGIPSLWGMVRHTKALYTKVIDEFNEDVEVQPYVPNFKLVGFQRIQKVWSSVARVYHDYMLIYPEKSTSQVFEELTALGHQYFNSEQSMQKYVREIELPKAKFIAMGTKLAGAIKGTDGEKGHDLELETQDGALFACKEEDACLMLSNFLVADGMELPEQKNRDVDTLVLMAKSVVDRMEVSNLKGMLSEISSGRLMSATMRRHKRAERVFLEEKEDINCSVCSDSLPYGDHTTCKFCGGLFHKAGCGSADCNDGKEICNQCIQKKEMTTCVDCHLAGSRRDISTKCQNCDKDLHSEKEGCGYKSDGFDHPESNLFLFCHACYTSLNLKQCGKCGLVGSTLLFSCKGCNCDLHEECACKIQPVEGTGEGTEVVCGSCESATCHSCNSELILSGKFCCKNCKRKVHPGCGRTEGDRFLCNPCYGSLGDKCSVCKEYSTMEKGKANAQCSYSTNGKQCQNHIHPGCGVNCQEFPHKEEPVCPDCLEQIEMERGPVLLPESKGTDDRGNKIMTYNYSSPGSTWTRNKKQLLCTLKFILDSLAIQNQETQTSNQKSDVASKKARGMIVASVCGMHDKNSMGDSYQHFHGSLISWLGDKKEVSRFQEIASQLYHLLRRQSTNVDERTGYESLLHVARETLREDKMGHLASIFETVRDHS